jgi:predicted nuclease of predicted toxin-antitoxin system
LAKDPGDDEILARAHAERRVLITLDKDFGNLAIAMGRPHCGIIWVVEIPAKQQAAACAAILAQHGDLLANGAIVTVSPGRVRIRPPASWAGPDTATPPL